jgi:UDP-N-acetylmuramoyl-tripeptide--D-alanyl-D-alanine ligase
MILSPQTFAEITDGLVQKEANKSIGPPSIDTRSLTTQDTFFALQGPRFDGHDFLNVALQRGAGTLVVQHDRSDASIECAVDYFVNVISVHDTEAALQKAGEWYRSQFNGLVVGITGSSGKTTTKEMLRTALSAHGQVVATRGNLNNHLGVPLSLAQLRSEPDFAVFEMGMNAPGEIRTLSKWVRADVAVITSIGQAHLEGVGSLEGVAHAKGELFETLAPQSIAICPSSAEQLAHLKAVGGSKLRTVGVLEHDTCRIINQRLENDASVVEFSLDGQTYELRLPCIGAHHISNALCALMAVSALGLAVAPCIEALSDFELPEMRGQRFTLPDGIEVSLDCYNANPQSMRAAIDAHMLRHTKDSLLVLGDMLELGEHSQSAHASLGHYIQQRYPGVTVIAVGEEMKQLCKVFSTDTPTSKSTTNVFWTENAAQAARVLSVKLGSNMNILIKGSRGLKLETVWHQMQN